MYTQARSIRDRHAPSRSVRTRESSPRDVDEEATKEDECQPRPSSSLSSSAVKRRDSACRRDSEDSFTAGETKRIRLDDEAAPRLRLNTSLATDPALRPAAVAALTVKPENTSPPNPTLPAGLQNGELDLGQVTCTTLSFGNG